MTDEQEQVNKRLHEIVGLCWRGSFIELGFQKYTRTDFVNTWEGFGILWQFMRKHERWEKFEAENGGYSLHNEGYVAVSLIAPNILAKAVVEFFEEK